MCACLPGGKGAAACVAPSWRLIGGVEGKIKARCMCLLCWRLLATTLTQHGTHLVRVFIARRECWPWALPVVVVAAAEDASIWNTSPCSLLRLLAFQPHVGRLFCENDDYDDYYDYSSYSHHSRAISHSRA